MEGRYLFLIVTGLVIAAMAFIAFYSTHLQRKSIGTHDRSMSKFDESLALARESVALQKDAAARQEAQIKLLSELVSLLREPDSGKGRL